MNVKRAEFLKLLSEASVGLTGRPILEQSDHFVFKGGFLLTFNDEIMARTKSPFPEDLTAAVNAADLQALVARFPDEEVDITFAKSEVRIKAGRRSAGLACSAEIALPTKDVPAPGKWTKLEDGLAGILLQAARTCGTDASQFLTTCVHIAPDKVEACDNIRFYRATVKTGFPKSVLVPASSLEVLDGMGLARVSMEAAGWIHFKTGTGVELTVRCSDEKYHEGVDELLVLKGAGKVVLPKTLGEMLERCGVMTEEGHDARVNIRVEDGDLTISTRKSTGWYREKKKCEYTGEALSFDIHPKFLAEVLEKTRKVQVGGGRLKLAVDNIQFVVALAKEKKEETDGSEETEAASDEA